MHATSRFQRLAIGAGVALSVLLASCGGGGDDGGPAPVPPVVSNTPPDSASASTDGFIAYLKILVATMPENTEPLDVASFVAPTSDTAPFDPSI